MTYSPSTTLPTATVFDYWDPVTAVQRVISGAAVDQMTLLVNGDFHEFHFSGLAQDLIDSSSFSAGGLSALESFPPEPVLAAFDYSIVPGNLGQAWLGTSALAVLHGDQCFNRSQEQPGLTIEGIWLKFFAPCRLDAAQ